MIQQISLRLRGVRLLFALTMAAAVLHPWTASTAQAQELSEDEIYGQLLPAVQEVMAMGLTGTLEDAPIIIEIYQRHGVYPAFEISVDEARWFVDRAREDRERDRFGRLNSVSLNGSGKFNAYRLTLVGQTQKLSCGERDAKAAAAKKLSRALSGVAWMNTVAAGVATATGAGAVLAPAFGLGAFVAGMSAAAAGWLASDYASSQCISGGIPWQAPSRIMAAFTDPRTTFRSEPYHRSSQRYGA